MRTQIILGVYQGVTMFLNIVSLLLIIYALMTWFVRPDSPAYRFMHRVCEPLVAPFRPVSRKLIMNGLRIDISVLLALLALRVVGVLLSRALMWIL